MSDPPEHGKAEQTPPILFPDLAKPSPYEILNATGGDTIPITVPLRSEDVGEGLLSELYLEYSIKNPKTPEDLLAANPLAAGTFKDGLREVKMIWDVWDNLKGCHQLTLSVTHNSNLQPRVFEDIATVTWWVNVSDTVDGTNLMKDCPKNQGATQ